MARPDARPPRHDGGAGSGGLIQLPWKKKWLARLEPWMGTRRQAPQRAAPPDRRGRRRACASRPGWNPNSSSSPRG
jgi:hypothetical protein